MTLDGGEAKLTVEAGASFDVPANSGFTIEVAVNCQYVCSYLT